MRKCSKAVLSKAKKSQKAGQKDRPERLKKQASKAKAKGQAKKDKTHLLICSYGPIRPEIVCVDLGPKQALWALEHMLTSSYE